jgi:DNA-binding MarR family transcriptional regulator
MDDATDQAAVEAARLLERAGWLNRARIDPSIPPSAFRVAAAIAAMTGNMGVLRSKTLKLAFESGMAKPAVRMALDRLAARRFITLNMSRAGRVEIRILAAPSQAALRQEAARNSREAPK